MSVSHLHGGYLGQVVVLKQQLSSWLYAAQIMMSLSSLAWAIWQETSVLEERTIILYGGVVLVLVLDGKTLPSKEAGLSLALPAKLNLEPLK